MTSMEFREFVDNLSGLFGPERGDVLMEYVIVTVFTVLPLVGLATSLFNPAGQTFTVDGTVDGENFGIIGNAFVEVYRRIMCGVSLPIP